MQKIAQEEAQWFATWITSGQSLPSENYKYNVLIPHPESIVDINKNPCIRALTANDIPLPSQQRALIDQNFLRQFSEETPCCLAVYAGYFDSWGKDQGFYEPEGTWIFGKYLNFVLFETFLKEGLFGATDSRWRDVTFTQLSYLWAKDHTWLLASAPDTAWTIVRTSSKELARQLLDEKALGAVAIGSKQAAGLE